MEKITENYTMEEFTRSETAEKLGIRNEPDSRAKLAIVNLCTKLLQPLREAYGKPMPVNSGYRCPELNKAVGGVPTSMHQNGEAADIRCDHPAELVRCLMDEGLDFDQCIRYSTFVHLSYKLDGENRRQFLKGEVLSD